MRGLPRSAAGPRTTCRCTEGPGEDLDPGAALSFCLEGVRRRGETGGGLRLHPGVHFFLLCLTYSSPDEGGLPLTLRHMRGRACFRINPRRAGLPGGEKEVAG
ncbi:hypothetical protein NDU88_001927 [Pleurodeles waltl]|uniref:Uncharacterized protein n=1 Tax=Pleurodeles waltl TaxID=8319 RepID=A0AAV7T1B2_PLEWA|nr:hypothetical protein NDU88_001927 [Pleurodeles waltl]